MQQSNIRLPHVFVQIYIVSILPVNLPAGSNALFLARITLCVKQNWFLAYEVSGSVIRMPGDKLEMRQSLILSQKSTDFKKVKKESLTFGLNTLVYEFNIIHSIYTPD